MNDVENRLIKMQSYLDTQEYRAMSKKLTEGMNRAERRDHEKKEEKLKKCIKSLTPAQFEVIEQLANFKADEKIDEFKDTLDRCLTATLILNIPDKNWQGISSVIDEFGELVSEDVSKILELKKICKGENEVMNKIMQKYESEIKERIEKLLEEGTSQKQAIETLVIEFPKLSKSMITNFYKQTKAAYDKEHDEIEPADIKEGVEAIMDIIEDSNEKVSSKKIIEESEKYLKKAEEQVKQPVVICEGNSCRIVENDVVEKFKANEKVVIEQKKPLKVLSMTVKGENGTYKVCPEGVELSNSNMVLFFENEKQIDIFMNEFKEVFAMVK